MNKITHNCIFRLAFLLALWSCVNSSSQNQKAQTKACVKQSSLPVRYAAGFAVDYYDGFKVITVKDWAEPSKILAQYVLMQKGKPMPVGFENAIAIDTSVGKIACISTTHMAEMVRLGLIDSIDAVTNGSIIYDKLVRQKIADGTIVDIGGADVNYEKLAELRPAFVMISGDYDGGDKLKLKLSTLNMKMVLNLEYKEQDPLARAEWLKFVAAFYNRETEADSIFKTIEKNYSNLKTLASLTSGQPTVFCNAPFKEIWYMPCADNYVTKLITDAGGNFLWKEAKGTNGLNLNLDFETVYAKAAGADFWINTGFANSLDEIRAADKKNALFKAFKTGNVYNNNKRNTPSGGFDFWESGVVNPDKVLADLIFIFHPAVIPMHQLYYYQKLK